eukprot:1893978-Rhodomonas_salina.1
MDTKWTQMGGSRFGYEPSGCEDLQLVPGMRFLVFDFAERLESDMFAAALLVAALSRKGRQR